jgi:hypothetical protein
MQQSLPKTELLAEGAQRIVTTAARASTDILSMQDLARGVVNWTSRIVSRPRTAHASRSNVSATRSDDNQKLIYSSFILQFLFQSWTRRESCMLLYRYS